MKVFRRALLSLCAAALSMADPASGSSILRVKSKKHVTNDDVLSASDDDVGVGHRKLDTEVAHNRNPKHTHDHNFPHSHDHQSPPPIQSSNKAVGCDCSKDDIDELLAAQSNILLPTGTLIAIRSALLTTNSTMFDAFEQAVSSCVEYGIGILRELNCGGCVDGHSYFDNIKTYDCCCDSDSIKDIIKDQLNSILAAFPLYLLGREDLFATMVNAYKGSATKAIQGIIDDYEDELSPSTTFPPPPADPILTLVP